MKTYISFLVCLLFWVAVYAQETTFALSLINVKTESLTEEQVQQLNTKVTQIIDRYGFVAHSSEQSFGIEPSIQLVEENIMEGMQKQTFVTLEFALVAKQVNGGIVLGSIEKIITGGGSNRSTAISNAIRTLSAKDASYQQFIDGIKPKMQRYYAENCETIIAKSDRLLSVGEPAAALVELSKVPMEAAKCSQMMNGKIETAFKAFQQQYCRELMQVAQAHIAANNYGTALSVLAMIDPSSSCGPQSLQLINRAEGQIDAELQRRWDWLRMVHKDRMELERYRYEAMVAIAQAYYGRADNSINILLVK